MSHQVFIERCRDAGPGAAESLARAVASKYGIDPQQILGRLQRGRFRVKANLDLASAQQFMAYLESEGALCSIVGPGGDVVATSAALTPAPPPETTDTDFLSLQTPPPPEDSSMQYESGLAAGFGSGAGRQGLGALDTDAASSGTLRLSMLDGETSDGPKKGPAPASVADVSDAAAFLPPEALTESLVELAEERPEIPEPVYDAPVPPPGPDDAPVSFRRMDESGDIGGESGVYSDIDSEEAAPVAPTAERLKAFALGTFRGRLILGVFLAFILGFALSSTIGGAMEDGQYAKALAPLTEAYADASTVEAWSSLDEARTAALESLERRRRNIVITSLLVWFAAAAVVLFVWLRVINWSRFEEEAPA